MAQVYQVLPQYGYEMKRVNPTLVLQLPTDTVNNKLGIARVGSTLYVGNGTYWTGGSGNYLDSFWRVSGIDSNYYRINGVTYAVLDSTGGGVSGWSLTGNSGTTAGTNFIGTTDNVDVVFKRNSIEGMRLQSGALGVTGNINLTATTSSATGVIFKGSNRFIHDFALAGTNGDNTFIGNQSGNFSMTGSSGSLGSYNVGVGAATLLSNTTGYRNTAIGTYALQNNTTGVNNTAVGQNASYSNTTGYNNTTMGIRAGAFGSGHDIVAYGVDAVSRNNNGIFTVGVGTDAFYNNWDGQYGVAVGDSTFWLDSTGFKNTAIGSRAGYYLGGNYATLHDSLVTFLGADASRDSSISSATALNNLTVIGYNAKGFASNQVVLGNDNVTTTLLKGNVGMGTVNPDSLLDVRGGVNLPNLYSSTNATDSMMVVNSTGGVGYRSIPSGGGGGTPSLTQYRLAVGDASNLLSSNAAITGNKALASDINGVPVASSTTDTELGYVSGVTSSVQGQLGTKADTSTVINSGAINWPGALYSTPTTASIAGHKISFAPALASQTSKYVFTNPSGSSGVPSFNLLDSSWLAGMHTQGYYDGRYMPAGQINGDSNYIRITANALGTTQIFTKGLELRNWTAAAAGAQQLSPALRFASNGWKTNATAESELVEYWLDVLPVQGTTAPTSQFRLNSRINGGTPTIPFKVDNGGTVTTTGNMTIGGNMTSTTNDWQFIGYGGQTFFRDSYGYITFSANAGNYFKLNSSTAPYGQQHYIASNGIAKPFTYSTAYSGSFLNADIHAFELNVSGAVNGAGGSSRVTTLYIKDSSTGANRNIGIEQLYGTNLLNTVGGSTQIGDTSIVPSSKFTVSSTTQGVLISRMTQTQRDAISSLATGLQVYNTTTNRMNVYNGTIWMPVGGISGSYTTSASAQSTFTVTIGATMANSSYVVSATPTATLTAAPYYVTNKTTTTFDVVYLSPLTGTATFDWSVNY